MSGAGCGEYKDGGRLGLMWKWDRMTGREGLQPINRALGTVGSQTESGNVLVVGFNVTEKDRLGGVDRGKRKARAKGNGEEEGEKASVSWEVDYSCLFDLRAVMRCVMGCLGIN